MDIAPDWRENEATYVVVIMQCLIVTLAKVFQSQCKLDQIMVLFYYFSIWKMECICKLHPNNMVLEAQGWNDRQSSLISRL